MSIDLGKVEAAFLGREEMNKVQSMCLCASCPAYPEEDRGKKVAYCLRGESSHKAAIEPSDCLCEMCEVYKHGKLYGQNFFCLEGPALAKGLRNVLKGDVITKLVDEKQGPGPAMFVSSGLDVHRREEH